MDENPYQAPATDTSRPANWVRTPKLQKWVSYVVLLVLSIGGLIRGAERARRRKAGGDTKRHV